MSILCQGVVDSGMGMTLSSLRGWWPRGWISEEIFCMGSVRSRWSLRGCGLGDGSEEILSLGSVRIRCPLSGFGSVRCPLSVLSVRCRSRQSGVLSWVSLSSLWSWWSLMYQPSVRYWGSLGWISEVILSPGSVRCRWSRVSVVSGMDR